MVKETTPFPSGYVPNQKRRNARNPMKEHRRNKSRRSTYEQWLTSALPGMVDSLCRKMYENEYRNTYSGRGEFCKEYAPLVIDQRRVKGPVEREKLLERILSLAEDEFRIDISGPERKLSIFLSDAEWKKQRKMAKERGSKGREKWQERRERKAA